MLLSPFHHSFCSPCSFLSLFVFLLLFFCNSLSSIVFIISTLVIGTFYCLNYTLLLLPSLYNTACNRFYNNHVINICRRHLLWHINITKFVLINYLEKDHGIIETRRFKNVVISVQTHLSFVLSRKITSNNIDIFRALLASNTTDFFRFCIRQYWHFQRVSSKGNYTKMFFRVYITQYWQFQKVTTKQYWLN